MNVSNFIAAGATARTWPYFEYDPTQSSVILVGGLPLQGTNPLTDSWNYRAGIWTNVTGAVQPIPVFVQGLMTYDAADGYSLEFGGSTISNYNDSNYTWAYSGGDWTNLTASVGAAPPPTDSFFARMAYDAADREVVLWERNTLYGPTSPVETWTYSGGRWTNITATAGAAPPGTIGGAFAYDAADGYLVEFGGTNVSMSTGLDYFENGTWEFHSGKWAELSSSTPSPTPRWFGNAPMVYDPPAQALVLFGGVPPRGTDLNDIWTFSGGNWTNVTGDFGGQSPSAGSLGDMVWDAADGYVLFLGESLNYHDTWLLGTPPPFARLNATPSPIEENETFTLSTLTAGGTGPLSYAYSGLPPGCATLNASSLNCSTPVAGMFPVTVNVTDSEGRSTVAHFNLTIRPDPSVARFAITPAEVHIGSAVQFNVNVSAGLPPIVLNYSGLPPGCPDQDALTFSCVLGTAGTFNVTVTVNDSIGMHATGRASVSAYALPRLTSFTVSSGWIDLGDPVTFLATVQGGAPPLSFIFGSLPSGCVPGSAGNLTCVPIATGDFDVSAEVVDGLGAKTANSSVHLHVQSDPAISGLTAAPNPLELGATLDLNATLVGGTAPYTVTWSGLPSGCSSTSLRFNCTPGSVGSFNVTVTVNDSLGHAASRMVSVEVVPSGGGGAGANFPTTLFVGGAIAAAVVIAGVAVGVVRLRRRRAATVDDLTEDPAEASHHA